MSNYRKKPVTIQAMQVPSGAGQEFEWGRLCMWLRAGNRTSFYITDTDSILFLHALPGDFGDYRMVDALLTKNRKGPVGRAPLVFFGAHQHFQARVDEVDNSEAGQDRKDRINSTPNDSEDVF